MSAPRTLTGDDLVELLASPVGAPALGARDEPLVVVDGPPERAGPDAVAEAVARLALVPVVVVGGAGWGEATPEQLGLVDLVAGDAARTGVVGAPGDDAAIAAVAASVARAPLAARSLAVHLRGADGRSPATALAAESVLYSMLQAGPEFAAWRSGTPVRDRPASATPAVELARDGDVLRVTLARPEVRNALNVRMRDELLDAFAVAAAEPAVQVVVDGKGPAFCSGGDLDEFGTAPDPVTAHTIRLDRSIGAAIARIAGRVSFRLHGACFGSGIELPAFAGRVVAAPSTMICLPELGLGLVPGAGGTASLPARIGRHATAWLAFSRLPVDAAVAQRWGLVDEVADPIF